VQETENCDIANLAQGMLSINLYQVPIMRNSFYAFSLLLISLGSFAPTAQAQDTVLNLSFKSRIDSIRSAILNQKRLIQVFTPSGYKPGSNETYDVMYVLDGGNWNAGMITRVQEFVRGEGYVPQTIIVSVLGIDRIKDFTPTHLENWKTSGGADNFLRFIKEELIPYVNKTYPSNGDNTLWGHSLGGMFATYAMLKEPATFKSYIAVDPSVWWDKNYVARMAADRLSTLAGLNATFYASGRDEAGMKNMKVDTLETVLKSHAPADLHWKVVSYPGESHSSVRLKTTYDGLRFTYTGLVGNIEFHPMNGLVLKDKPIKLWYFEDTTNVRYTLDSTIPTRRAAKVQPEVTLAGGGKVIYTRFTQRSRYDKSTTGNFTVTTPLPPVRKPKDLIPGGFQYRYYEGDWNTWPDLSGLKPTKTGITENDVDIIGELPRKKDYALVVEGYVETTEEGYYVFLLQADKGTKFYLGNRLLMQWDGGYTRQSDSYLLPLQKGLYPIRIEYLHKNEDFKLRVSYLTPSRIETKDPKPIPAAMQYRKRS
jgi:predicted alpha/beta superfamily hydrolase